jgi:hypothetical protein
MTANAASQRLVEKQPGTTVANRGNVEGTTKTQKNTHLLPKIPTCSQKYPPAPKK